MESCIRQCILFSLLAQYCGVEVQRYNTGLLVGQHIALWTIGASYIRLLTAKLCWCPFSSVPHVSDHLELHINNWASWTLHRVCLKVQEAQLNYLLHTVHLSMRSDMPVWGSNARGAKYAVYYESVVMGTVFENIKWLHSVLCQNKRGPVASFACLFPCNMKSSCKWSVRLSLVPVPG